MNKYIQFFSADDNLSLFDRQIILDQIAKNLYIKEIRKKKLEKIYGTKEFDNVCKK